MAGDTFSKVDIFDASEGILSYFDKKQTISAKTKNLKWAWQAQKTADRFNRAMLARDSEKGFRHILKTSRDVLSTQKAILASNGMRGRSALEIENDTIKKAEDMVIDTYERAYYKNIVLDIELGLKEREYVAGRGALIADRNSLNTELMMSAFVLIA